MRNWHAIASVQRTVQQVFVATMTELMMAADEPVPALIDAPGESEDARTTPGASSSAGSVESLSLPSAVSAQEHTDTSSSDESNWCDPLRASRWYNVRGARSVSPGTCRYQRATAVSMMRTFPLSRFSEYPREQYRQPRGRLIERPVLHPRLQVWASMPHLLFGGDSHQVNPPIGMHGLELRSNEFRNHQIKSCLKVKRAVTFIAGGDALAPVVRDGEVATFKPVASTRTLQIGDIVFVTMQPEMFELGLRIYGNGAFKNGSTHWQLRDMRDPCVTEGWCQSRHIYGRLKCPSVHRRLHRPMSV